VREGSTAPHGPLGGSGAFATPISATHPRGPIAHRQGRTSQDTTHQPSWRVEWGASGRDELVRRHTYTIRKPIPRGHNETCFAPVFSPESSLFSDVSEGQHKIDHMHRIRVENPSSTHNAHIANTVPRHKRAHQICIAVRHSSIPVVRPG
jgi:hypothetical protein